MRKRKNTTEVWYKPEIKPDRKLDMIDDAVVSMALAIKWMHRRGVPFPRKTYQALIADYRVCARLNWSLTPTQRLAALKVINARTSSAELEDILRPASKL